MEVPGHRDDSGCIGPRIRLGSALEALGVIDQALESRMKQKTFGIAIFGESRLREAVEAKIRAEHQLELAGALDEAQRSEIEDKIKRKIKEEMKRVASPYSLWSSR
jgi:hypothetical protein